MIEKTSLIFPINPIIEQTKQLNLDGRLLLNEPTGAFFGDPWVVKSEFKDTPIGDVLFSLGDTGEARLMKLNYGETYTAHADPDDRFHLSIITNPYAYLVDLDEKQLYHLPPDGRIWRMDTSRVHIAANFGSTERIHLNVRCLLPKYKGNGIRINIESDQFNWKFESYIEIMPFINRECKLGRITGFDCVSDKEILINITDEDALTPIVNRLEEKGFTVAIEPDVLHRT